jgi:hypothetical protein
MKGVSIQAETIRLASKVAAKTGNLVCYTVTVAHDSDLRKSAYQVLALQKNRQRKA